MKHIWLIKLGGSCFSDKRSGAMRSGIINQFAAEISDIYNSNKDLSFVIGTGAGYKGHSLATAARNADGTYPAKQAKEIQSVVRRQNADIIECLAQPNVPCEQLSPHQFGIAQKDGAFVADCKKIEALLGNQRVVSVYGDVVQQADGIYRVCSTEQVFYGIAECLKENYKIHVALLTNVDGVLDRSGAVIASISKSNQSQAIYQEYSFYDVTGAMAGKVASALRLKQIAQTVHIASGTRPGVLSELLKGRSVGTAIV